MPTRSLSFSLIALLTPLCFGQSYTISTIAGGSRLLDGHAATSVPLRYPWGVAQDAAGNIYLADTSDNRIRRVDTNGIITTIAGTGVAGFNGDNGPGTAAMLDEPQGLKVDGKGNLFIADYQNNRVRKLNLATGIISTVAGSGDYHFSGDGHAATAAGLDPYDIAVDASGNLYIADYYNNRIRKVSATDGTISSIAGTGIPGDGDNGPATLAALNGPIGISVDANNIVYFIDSVNNRVKRIDQVANKISTAVGSGQFGYGEPQYDGDGGAATQSLLLFPFSTAVEANGNLLVQCAFEVWRVTVADGKIHFIAGGDTLGFGGDGGSAIYAQYNVLIYAGAAPNGDVLLADVGNFRVRRIHANVVNTVAGTSILDNIPATSAFLSFPDGVLPNGKGGLYVADTGDSRIRAVSGNNIASFLGTGVRGSSAGELFFPSAMAMDAHGGLYIADTENDRVMLVVPGGAPTAFAGGSATGFGGDGGYAPRALLSSPSGVAVDNSGNLYIADSGNFRIRMVDSNQNISTFAGTGSPRATGDNGPADKAGLSVNDIAYFAGSLYLTDTVNHRIRKIDLSTKIITTVVGIGTPGWTGDGGPAFSAQLKLPTGIAFDAAGNMYIADNGNSVVRRVSAGTITTIAGTGQPQFTVETGTALGVPIDPTRVAIDPNGSIYVTDRGNDRVRKLTAQIPATLTINSVTNNQSGVPGDFVSVAVKIVDASGTPVGNVLVNFTVTSGSATLAASGVSTAGNGVASVIVTLGSTPGPVTISAVASGLPPVTFTLTVTAPPPTTNSPQINPNGVSGAGFSTPLVTALSTGGIGTVKGQNFGVGPTFLSIGQNDLVNGQVPLNFHGVCVTVGTTRAPIYGASDTQVNFQTPVVGSATSVPVNVIAGCDTPGAVQSSAVTVAIQPATPEFFYWANNSDGQNPVIATDSQTSAPLGAATLYAGFVPAYPGENVTIYATGFGATNPAILPGVYFLQAAPVAADATVILGGQQIVAANVAYVGVTPGSPGLYQLNFQVPPGAPDGDLPLVISIGGISSPAGPYLTVLHKQ
jgi:uncharacterized protein (TIGR03437 family)